MAQGAYYIESNGEAAIVDAASAAIDLANQRGAKIKYVLETHFHADFVSGHVTLAERLELQLCLDPTPLLDFRSTARKMASG